MNKFWIAAGGTGGHIYPALHLYEEMTKAGWHGTWIGGEEESLEKTICKQNQINFFSTDNLKWQGFARGLQWLFKLGRSVSALWRLQRKEKPSFILVMGGYPSLSSGLVAVISRTKLYLHEQNSVLGQTNRSLYPFIRSGFVAYGDLCKRWPKLQLVGNPSRMLPMKKPKRWQGDKLKILSFGGSGGARQINQLITEINKKHTLPQCEFWHIAGKQGNDMLALNGANIKVETYNHDIVKALQWADLAITRSGAMTLTELALNGLPALLLPYPFAKDNHQTTNAEAFIEQGAALWCANTAQGMVDQIMALCENPDHYNAMVDKMLAMQPAVAPEQVIIERIGADIKQA
jgi:UDP-N-acetylglucosamine--N-acetylmuramyl-(pentapeptide) pyrophosphoryl-undecaprenol N-acetylglucosamine transferase